MAQCGTAACLESLFKTMERSGMQQEAMSFLPFLAFIKDPNPEVIGLLMVGQLKIYNLKLSLIFVQNIFRLIVDSL